MQRRKSFLSGEDEIILQSTVRSMMAASEGTREQSGGLRN